MLIHTHAHTHMQMQTHKSTFKTFWTQIKLKAGAHM